MDKTVLIVEDNELNMKLFRDILEVGGIKAIEAFRGDEVIEIARRRQPDLILMDIQLPGMSGLDVTKLIKSDDDLKKIPVIAITAFAMKGDKSRMFDAGCEDYISKPVSVSDFLDKVNQYLKLERS